MNTAHTPGPWLHSHRQKPNGMYDTEVYCKEGKTIATLSWYPMPRTAAGVTSTYRTANARLIAAAPELLQACQAFMNYRTVAELDVVVGLVREAISKATGAAA